MNKFYKKLSIIFITAFTIMLGCFTNVLAADSTNYVPKKDYSSNLVANYKFNETSGTTCIDSTGKYNGTYNNVTLVDTPFGKGANFTGNTADSYISFTDKVIPLGKKSIRFKFKTNYINTEQLYIFNTNNNLYTSDIGIGICITKLGEISAYYFKQNNVSFSLASGNYDYRDGQWHEVLFTWDGTTNTNAVKIYVDDMITPKSTTTSHSADTVNYTNNLTIGRLPYHNTTASRRYVGQLDEVEIYNDVVEYESKSSGISLNKTSTDLIVGQIDTLTATITPENATNKNVIWSSSDPSIATVDENGKVTALKEGTVTITATVQNESNLSATCIVTVKAQNTTPPTDNTGNAILTITMTNGNVKSYTVSMTKVNDFISWYNNRSSGSNGSPYYAFDKIDNLQPFIKKTEYIVFDKISSFEVDEYSK